MRALWIVIGFELRRMLTGPRGVVTVLATLVSLGATIIPSQGLFEQVRDLKADAIGVDPLKPAYGVIAEWTELSLAEVAALFNDYPAHFVAFFAALLWMVPILAYIIGYDQTATDIRARNLRFQLLRVNRATLLLGRALASLSLLGLIYATTLAIFLAVMSSEEGGIGGVTGLMYCIRIWLCAILFTLPLVALLSWTNVLTGGPRMALASAIGLQMTVAFVSWKWSDVPVLQDADLLFPTLYKYNLLSDDFAVFQLGGAHLLGLTAVFAALAWFTFRRRDV